MFCKLLKMKYAGCAWVNLNNFILYKQFKVLNQIRTVSTKTFSLEDTLPNLTVPSLENTIEKYLYSVKAVASEKEYENTQEICLDFLNRDGKIMQNILKDIKKNKRNYMEEWYDGKIFFGTESLCYLNFVIMPSNIDKYWPAKEGARAERMAFGMYALATYWKILREEKLEPHKANDGSPLSMDQFRYIFNTSRNPHPKEDKLVSYFKTTNEGYAPFHTVVICKGYFFKLELINKEGTPFTPPQIQKALLEIEEICKYRTTSPGVAALTALDRESWAIARQNLLDIDPVNKHSLYDIDSAVSVATMDENQPVTNTEVQKIALSGDPSYRWRDKSHNSIWFKNGTFSSLNEHCGIDALSIAIFTFFKTNIFMQSNGKWMESKNTDYFPKPEELQFILDNRIIEAISKGKNIAKKFEDDINILCVEFCGFGKAELRKFKVHQEAFIQISMQLAFIRLHGKPAITNRTSTLRKYYHGRLDICRTCTPELVEFCQAVVSGDEDAVALLRPAHDRLVKHMKDCQNNKGCDRHLLGLSYVAQKEKMDIPLFKDPMYKKTGGFREFDIFSSFLGSFDGTGGSGPQTDDGYGMFINISDDKIVYMVSSWNYSKVSDIHQFNEILQKTFHDVLDMFKQCS